MTLIRTVAALALAVMMSGCGSGDLPSMSAADGLKVASKNDAPGVMAPRYQLAGLRIAVPDSLRVSEANGFYPLADIVWRGEPLADRHAQVRAIFAEGIQRGTAGLTTGIPAIAEVEVVRFHCLTEKTRYTIGGVHSIRFMLTLRDPVTGRVLDGPRKVTADVKASGGAKAVAEDAAGRTQRVVIVEGLAGVFRRELGGASAGPVADARTVAVLQSTADVANASFAGTAVQARSVDAALAVEPTASVSASTTTAVPAPLATGPRDNAAVSPWDWIDLPPARLLN